MINLAVVFGSRTCEHDVSIVSGLQAVTAAEKGNYHVVPLYIARDGNWYIGEKLKDVRFYEHFDPAQVTRVQPVAEKGKLQLTEYQDAEKLLVFKKAHHVLESIDVVMPVMHGMNGEDGTLQGMLELWNIPYTSSGVLGSALGMDKIAMKRMFKACGFPVLRDVCVERSEWKRNRAGVLSRVMNELSFPVYVKPSNLGSSIGINRADNKNGLEDAIDIAVSYDRRVQVETGILDLMEINCAVLGYGGDAMASVTEMPVRWSDFLSFDEKYLRGAKGGAKGTKGAPSKGMSSLSRQMPAPISPELTHRVEELAVDAFKALDCKGVARIDFLYDKAADELYIGEINTIPGSLAFYLWEGRGISFERMIDMMVEYAFRANADRNENVFSYQSAILSGSSGAKGAKR